MDFGLVMMTYPGCWEDAAFAEQHGFNTVGFVDSPILVADPFVCMALTAKATKSMRVGTLLNVPGLRGIAATASSLATVNSIAPGRVFFGIGTGFTARECFGLKPLAASKVRDYANEIRALLAGERVVDRTGSTERSIRLRHPEGLRVDPSSPIPIYIAGDGPKALRAAGEAADGLITTLQYAPTVDARPAVLADSLATVRAAAAEFGRNFDDAYSIYAPAVCVLEPGESAMSPRALDQIGPMAIIPFHNYACHPETAEYLPEAMRERLEVYDKEVLSRLDVPPELYYQEVHTGHLRHLVDGEAAVLTEEVIRMITLTGTAEEIAGQLRELEAAGLKNISFTPPPKATREVVLTIEEQIMPLLGKSPVGDSGNREAGSSPQNKRA